MTTSTTFLLTTSREVSEEQDLLINKLIAEFDDQITYIYIDVPGRRCTGWLQRNADGYDSPTQRKRNERAIEVVSAVLDTPAAVAFAKCPTCGARKGYECGNSPVAHSKRRELAAQAKPEIV